jgi:hypothetical protein
MTLKLEDIDPKEDIRMTGSDLIGYLVDARFGGLEAYRKVVLAWFELFEPQLLPNFKVYIRGNDLVDDDRNATKDIANPPIPAMKANADDIMLAFHQKDFIEALPDVARQRFITANSNNPKLAEAKQQLADGLVADIRLVASKMSTQVPKELSSEQGLYWKGWLESMMEFNDRAEAAIREYFR